MVQFTDWALNEECNQFGECGGYSVYIAANKAVFQVEYPSRVLLSLRSALQTTPRTSTAS